MTITVDGLVTRPGTMSWGRLYTSVSVFLLGALALVAPTGYSYGSVLLLLGSAGLLVSRPPMHVNREDRVMIVTLMGYGLLAMGFAWIGGEGVRGFDKPLRFLLAAPIGLLILAYPPKLSWLWCGMAVGAVGAGILSGWEKLIADVPRPGGFGQPIQFGNIGMLMGVLCLSGLGWAVVQKRRRWWVGLLILGAVGGFLASIFSGSRGGWVGLPLMLVVLYCAYGREISAWCRIVAVGAIVGLFLLVWAIPQIGVQHRVERAVSEIQLYISGEQLTSSIGNRFEMWRGAGHLFVEKPLLGWGDEKYRQAMKQLADEGVIQPKAASYGHAHNEFVDHAAKHGVIGLLAIIGLYGVPIVLFWPGLKAKSSDTRALAAAGMTVSVGFIGFSLTQGMMSHNSGAMVYAFWLATFWGCYSASMHHSSLPGALHQATRDSV
ncbi:O-antigen ligase family protein [Aidingimonas lacisalsi]|uniref:O-antigen ligase family protein n=1 Tax=Aidingimonas lacisalsi TaxID=2604086 RepID=UPI001F1E383D|nr:O-antigen ligase [Aidingimonas lacisalsi]